jgi:DUF971 family protein
MQDLKQVPIKIKVHKLERNLSIDWNDGHKSNIEFGLLRAACPCATCRGGHENMKPEPDSSMFEILLPESTLTRLEKINMVGSYGLTMHWEDGHNYGIYTWLYLRALCSCEECIKNRDSNKKIF